MPPKRSVIVMAVCGTPGSGKTTLCHKIARKLSPDIAVKCICVSEMVRDKKLYKEYDDDLDACVMDSKAVNRELKRVVLNSGSSDSSVLLLIETHTPSILPKKLVEWCVVLECQTHTIYDRLTLRSYSARKREENVEAEIMQVVKEEASQRFPPSKIIVIPNDIKSDLSKGIKQIKKLIKVYC